jgi:hypothetical protein
LICCLTTARSVKQLSRHQTISFTAASLYKVTVKHSRSNHFRTIAAAAVSNNNNTHIMQQAQSFAKILRFRAINRSILGSISGYGSAVMLSRARLQLFCLLRVSCNRLYRLVLMSCCFILGLSSSSLAQAVGVRVDKHCFMQVTALHACSRLQLRVSAQRMHMFALYTAIFSACNVSTAF